MENVGGVRQKIIFEESDIQAVNTNKTPPVFHYVECPECGHMLCKEEYNFEELPRYKYDKLMKKKR